MEKFNTDLTQTLKWLQNNAPNLESLVTAKAAWYNKYTDQFWVNWYHNVFNLDTCDAFGIYVWCEILGVPKSAVNLEPRTNLFAFGEFRENFVYSGTGTPIPAADRNTVGGNFFGSGQNVINNIDEARIMLKLRYAALISDGRIAYINNMLKWILNGGADWDEMAGKYAYVTDLTQSFTPDTEVVNLLTNPGFEGGGGWSFGTGVIVINSALARTGGQCVSNSDVNTSTSFTQSIALSTPIAIGKVIDFGLYIRLVGAAVPGGVGVNDQITITLNTANPAEQVTKTIHYSESINNGGYVYCSSTITATYDNVTSIDINATLICNTVNGILFDDAYVAIQTGDKGSWIARDWQGETQAQYGAQYQIVSGGNLWNGSSTNSNPPVQVTDLAHNLAYYWSGAQMPGFSTNAPRVVGGDNRQYNGPDYFGVADLANGTHMPGYSNAVKAIRTLEIPTPDSAAAPNVFPNLPVYGGQQTIGFAKTAGTVIQYMAFFKKDTANVNTLMLCETRLNKLGRFVDPVRVFVDTTTGDWLVRGYQDDNTRSKTRAMVTELPGGWFKVMFYEVLNGTGIANDRTSHGMYPLFSDYNSPAMTPLAMNEGIFLFGYSALFLVSAPLDIPTIMPMYSYRNPIYQAGVFMPFSYLGGDDVAKITCDIGLGGSTLSGNDITRRGQGAMTYSMLQPTASVSFAGTLNGQLYSRAQNLIPEASGYQTVYRVTADPNTPAPPNQNFYMQYVFGPAFQFSPQFTNFVSDRDNGILPANAGISFGYAPVQIDSSDIDFTKPELDYRVQYGYGTTTDWVSQFSQTSTDTDMMYWTTSVNYWPLQQHPTAIGRLYPQMAGQSYWYAGFDFYLNSSQQMNMYGNNVQGNTATVAFNTPAPNTAVAATINLVSTGIVSGTGIHSAAGFYLPARTLQGTVGDYDFSFYADCTVACTIGLYLDPVMVITAPMPVPFATVNLTPGGKRYNLKFNAPDGIMALNGKGQIFTGIIQDSGTAQTANFKFSAPSLRPANGTDKLQPPVYLARPGASGGATGKVFPATVTVENPGLSMLGFTLYFSDTTTKSFTFNAGERFFKLPNADYDYLDKLILKLTYF